MSLLRKVPAQTAGSLAAWDGLLSRWSESIDLLTTAKEDEGGSNGSMVAEAASVTGFLCSLGGVCLMSSAPTAGKQDVTAGGQTPMRNVRRFLQRLLQLLQCDLLNVGAEVRAMVKEGLGQELNPTLYALPTARCPCCPISPSAFIAAPSYC